VVSLPHGWAVSNLNAILDEHHRDPLSGNAVLAGVPIELRAL
jgi:hypothetical protein